MAAVPASASSDLPRRGDIAEGQYVNTLVVAQSTPEVIAQIGVKQPGHFDCTACREIALTAECDIKVIETFCWQEPHANGELLLNQVAAQGRSFSGSSIRPCLSARLSRSCWQRSQANANNHDVKT